MKECLEIFDECLNEECEKDGGYAVIDMNQMLGNLTSVCFSLVIWRSLTQSRTS